MSEINRGNQIINSFDFKHPAKGSHFNNFLRGLVVPGIYSGGNVTQSGNNIVVAPFRVIFQDGTEKIHHIHTTIDATFTPSAPDDNIFYMTYTYKEEIDNWIDWGFRSAGSAPVTNEVILCKINFSGPNISSIENSAKTYGFFDENFNVRIDGNLDVLSDPTTQTGIGNLAFNDNRYMSNDYYSQKLLDFQNRIQNTEEKLLHNSLDLSYITQRKSNFSDWLIETFFDRTQTSNNYITNQAEILDNKTVGWSNNWKNRRTDNIDYKNGFIRPSKMKAYGDILDFYDTSNVGGLHKQSLSRYDSINDCYWMMTVNLTNDAPNWISKIRLNDATHKIEVLSQWALDEPLATSNFYTGIDVTLDSQYLFVTFNNELGTVSDVGLGKLRINDDNTLGRNHTPPGNSIYWSDSWTGNNDFDAFNLLTRVADGNYYPDLTVWGDNHVALIRVESTGSTGFLTISLEFFEIADNGSGVFLVSNSRTDIVGFEEFFRIGLDGSGDFNSFTCIKDGSDLWIKGDSVYDNLRVIQKFLISEDAYTGSITLNTEEYHGDIVGYLNSSGSLAKVIRSSMRLKAVTQDETEGNGQATKSGISISKEGDLLESVDTANSSRVLYKRSLSEAILSENIVVRDVPVRRYLETDVSQITEGYGCMVENSRYYWTGDVSNSANVQDIWRFDTETGTYKHARLTGANWTNIYDMTYNPNTDVFYIIGQTSTNYELYFGDLSDFVALMGDTFNVVNTIDLTTWGTQAYSSTTIRNCVAYDSDDDIIYLYNDTSDVIDSLSLDGIILTTSVYNVDLTDITYSVRGLACKNDLLYITVYSGTSTPNFIYAIDKSKSATTPYVVHIYGDPAFRSETDGTFGIDFHGNDLVAWNKEGLKFHKYKTLLDPDVLQLHTFILEDNVLQENFVVGFSPIQQRYHTPDEFKEWLPVDGTGAYDPSSTDYMYIPSRRNVPDKNYMVVHYDTAGLSILNLDEYLSEKSSSGLDRRDVRNIRTINFERGGTTLANDNLVSNHSTYNGFSLACDRDVIFFGGVSGDPYYVLDLTVGRVLALDTANTRWYLGTLSEKNDGKGYTDPSDRESDNDELFLSSNDHYISVIRTFSKEDTSDYSFENPRTYVILSHSSGGQDLLVLEWNSNNTKTLVKVWNNIFGAAGFGKYSVFIAPSGRVFYGNDANGGPIYMLKDYIWDVSSDDPHSNSGFYTVATSSEVGSGYPYKISPKSPCWKLPTGEWRHILVWGTLDDGAGTGIANLNAYDVENSIYYPMISYNAAYYGWRDTDTYEDRVFSVLTDFSGTSNIRGLHVFKYSPFETRDASYGDTNTYSVAASSKWQMEMYHNNSNPRFLYANYDDAYNKNSLFYSEQYGILGLGSQTHGIQFFLEYNNDACKHESIDIDTENPNYYYYLQNAILDNKVRTNEE